MLPSRQQPRHYETITRSQLEFKKLTLDDVRTIAPMLERSNCRTCDFTIGGLLMWADYFNYTYAILNDTLFIKGVTEDDVTRPAFSLPIGRMGIEESVDVLRDYCLEHDAMPLTFSAIPEEFVADFQAVGPAEVTELTDWADYLYEADALASLSGKKLSKKRNHVNRFMTDNPGFEFKQLTTDNLEAVKSFFHATHLPLSKPALADIEREQVIHVLDNLDRYPFEGAVLSTPTDGIVAFAIGEVVTDTLFVHIEKMNHLVAGAGETINKMFAEWMTGHHPEVRYINREEDVGDEGLRKAKESYHPAEMLKKYNITML